MSIPLFIQLLTGGLFHGILVFGILIHVTFQEALQGSQDSFEGGPRDVEANSFAHRIDAGFSGLSTEQCNLSKIFAFTVLLHLDLTLLAGDASDCLATSKDEHLVVLLALLHDGLIIIKLLFFQHLCQRTDLILGQSGEDVATIQELAGLLELRLTAAHHEVSEGRPVQAPHLRVVVRRDGGAARTGVEQGHLAKSEAGAALENLLWWIITLLHEDVKVALLHNVEVVALITLLDHILPLGNLLDEHGIQNLLKSILGDGAKEHVNLGIPGGFDNV
mmetsp:Transcript_24078/g.52436  ORF Transcript_24078/g.52436 Transcript_24078/m.52436 type:complete len:276 (+) Transcript_24078:1478-2305(+)